ncbi:MAG TPA: hypothetical protein ENK05_03810 [Gammaproteobacteria bacterium]|nr:hypothetical protein [Gammaproteobacteria bacterium]
MNIPRSIALMLIAGLGGAPAVPVLAADNPFALKDGDGALRMAAGKCGQGKCGVAMMGNKGMKGSGKCGLGRMDSNGDGKVTREEFMKGHEAVFERIDRNGDGVLDADERNAHMQMMRQNMGKCGTK